MKRFFLPLLGIIAICYVASCSKDFKVAAPYKNYTVVYGLLDMKDTAHYVRIEKAFLDENLSAVNLAQVADSNYYPQLDVVIREVGNGTILQTIALTRVDLNTEGYPKDSGAFYTSPSYAYKFKANLNPSYTYRLVIANASLKIADSATTYIIDDSNDGVFTANTSKVLDFQRIANSITFYSKYAFPNDQPASADTFLQGILRFNWVDSGASGSSFHQADMNIGTAVITKGQTSGGGNNTGKFMISNSAIYNFLASALGPATNGAGRYFDSCDIIVYGGSGDLYTYNERAALQGTGIAGSQVQPVYTNITGSNVLGLFTNRGNVSTKSGISQQTLDSLINASNLGSLNGLNIRGFR